MQEVLPHTDSYNACPPQFTKETILVKNINILVLDVKFTSFLCIMPHGVISFSICVQLIPTCFIYNANFKRFTYKTVVIMFFSPNNDNYDCLGNKYFGNINFDSLTILDTEIEI